MSAQRLSPKTMRRIERNTGLPVVRAWAHGGYVYAFVTPDHKHWLVDSKTWELEEDTRPLAHYYSCEELFPEWDKWADWRKRHPGRTPGESVLNFTTTGEAWADTITSVATFAPEIALAVEEIDARFPALGKGGTYAEHGEDEPGGLPSRYYSADFWSTDRDVHDAVFDWIRTNAVRLNLKYVISWGRIWSVERADEGVRVYRRDANQDGVLSPSEKHTNHVHTSFNESGYYMPSLSDIRKAIREELQANNDNAAEAVWEADVIPNAWGDPNQNPTVRAKNAVAQIGRDTVKP